MICKSCGTEIADKALICYRCGAATSEPAARRPLPRRRGTMVSSVTALAVMVILALYLTRAAIGETPRVLGWVLFALAAIVFLSRFFVRRPR